MLPTAALPPDAAAHTLDRARSDVVLIVDDVPDNLAVLHDALDESGYTVLVATSGETALSRAAQALPDVVLLDAMMPGMDGFEVARRLKALPATAHIPIIFMTGLTETEHLVAALDAGGVDYVTKPIKPKEVLARMNVHLQGARRARQEMRQAGQARNALDAFGYASITVRASDGRLMWQTALARELLHGYFGGGAGGASAASGSDAGASAGTASDAPVPLPAFAPAPVTEWLKAQLPHVADLAAQQQEPPRLVVEQGARRLSFSLHQQTGDSEGGGDWLIVMREVSDAAVIEAMGLSFKLTAREAEVLYWLVKGKTNRDIGDILGASPATVKKHLERVYVKLGVETRTAAAGIAMARIRQTHPQFEG
ncbi:response regulator transcription factor [Acidovorax sp. SUPP3334]|uniref:response regulator transcription factor n=1 Tax=Acidovorax sp. SUPP3334 TaxID=2920881 RepID=UPI0023DE2A87|nr:response regulator transcription factor [Acidovorax sp. SUPP3334]GKT25779.1 response regulator transcription factor [Acidovorax sp. SUPP3334]